MKMQSRQRRRACSATLTWLSHSWIARTARTFRHGVVTGKRMLKTDWSFCPGCKFPGRRPMLLKVAQDGDSCPLCDCKIKPADVPLVADASEHISDYKTLFQSSVKSY